MIRSMTGFGKSETNHENKKITIEVKALNSKQLDLSMKVPGEFRQLEYELRNKAAVPLQRGKIEISLSIADGAEKQLTQLDHAVAEAYLEQIKGLSEKLQIALPEDLVSVLLKLPGVYGTQEETISEAMKAAIFNAMEQAIASFDGFRIQEGLVLKTELMQRIQNIQDLLNQVDPFEKQRFEQLRTRLSRNLSEYSETGRYDENRFEQELIYYFEKLDITEEKVRLKQHCDYFGTTIDEDNAGKKLGFISQEIGREINTLGSKANEANIQHLVVQMKDELEKIKEQLFNIL